MKRKNNTSDSKTHTLVRELDMSCGTRQKMKVQHSRTCSHPNCKFYLYRKRKNNRVEQAILTLTSALTYNSSISASNLSRFQRGPLWKRCSKGKSSLDAEDNDTWLSLCQEETQRITEKYGGIGTFNSTLNIVPWPRLFLSFPREVPTACFKDPQLGSSEPL